METTSSDRKQGTIEELIEAAEITGPKPCAPAESRSYGIIGIAIALLIAAIGLLLYL